ncbi:phage baseplate protein [Bifidobacterium goeldii]|uniref:phage baseplate protein n=1 Tax=Bifidobacterium goeldii TaxID=2306975 RepID=UPI003B974896
MQLATDRFLVGAGSKYTAGNEGGSATHALTINEMPSHKHTLDVKVSGQNAGSNNSVSAGQGTGTTLLNAQTTHVGGGQAFSIMPPYKAVYFWQRTA